MAAQVSLHQFISNLEREGASQDLVKIVTEINFQSRQRGVLPIYTLAHLAHMASISYEKVDQIVTGSVKDNYKSFSIAKKSGGVRNIRAPKDDLATLQRTILEIAIPSTLISESAHGYVRNRDTLSAASRHVGAKSMVTLDIADFYGSIRNNSVYPIFLENGYPRLLAMQLTILSTVGLRVAKRARGVDREAGEYPYIINGLGRLPQGAPTSGALSNVVMRPIDDELERLGIVLGATYTRYADDMQFSFGRKVSNHVVNELISGVRKTLSQKNLGLNNRKIKVQRNSSSMNMLGLCVSDRGVRVDSRYRKRIFSFIRSIEIHGVDLVAQYSGKKSGLEVIASLEGHLLYVKHVDPELFNEIGPQVRAILGLARLR